MGKNKFIDKKKSATFQLLARDTSDPNYSTSDRVFVRVDYNQYKVDGFSEDEEPANDAVPLNDPNSMFDDAPEDYYEYQDDVGYGDGYSRNRAKMSSSSASASAAAAAALPDHIRREILELGFPDDGYNYLTHLREIKNSGGGSVYYQNPKAQIGRLPPDVKAYIASRMEISRVEDESNEKSMYAVASKTVNAKVEKVVDDEIAALLDDSDLSRLGSDVEDLEEDFVVKANLPEGPSDLELDKKLRLLEETEVNRIQRNGSVLSGMQDTVLESSTVEEEKQRVRRPLDEQFDLLELQEYGADSDDEYGGYDTEEDNYQESLSEKLNHALKDRALNGMDNKYIVSSDVLQEKNRSDDVESPESAADVIQRCREYAEKYEDESEDEKEVVFQESSDESEVWDCETIVSTYSNLDNHPGKIGAPETRRKKKLVETFSATLSSPSNKIALKGKEKLPVDFLPTRKHATDKAKDGSSLRPEQPKRKQHGQESKEEKKERKAAVKEERCEARRTKKEMKELYKCEAQRAQKVAAFAGPPSVHLM